MLNIKKKLNALIPGESARGALQNVLTVEWSGHKTVLVQVPNAESGRSNEMEMSGMGDGGDYGRLIDDDEDERAFNRSRGFFDQPRSSPNDYDDLDTPPPLPPKMSHHSSTLPMTKSHSRRLESNNPFEIHDEDFEPISAYKSNHTYSGKAASSRPKDLLFDAPQKGWRTFGGEDNKAAVDPWAGRGWGTGNGQGQTSPTSSTGTRFSGQSQAEDPFRN